MLGLWGGSPGDSSPPFCPSVNTRGYKLKVWGNQFAVGNKSAAPTFAVLAAALSQVCCYATQFLPSCPVLLWFIPQWALGSRNSTRVYTHETASQPRQQAHPSLPGPSSGPSLTPSPGNRWSAVSLDQSALSREIPLDGLTIGTWLVSRSTRLL